MVVRRRRFLLAGGAVTVVLIAALAAGIWHQFLRGDAPPPVSIEAAVASLHHTNRHGLTSPILQQPTSPSLDSGNTSGTPADGQGETHASAPDGLNGEWTIAEPSNSFAGYRITEQLASIDAAEVVGRTTGLEGAVRIEQLRLESAEVTVDMASVRSDQRLRDEALEIQALETADYPTATFDLTEPVKLPDALTEGEAASFSAIGDLTVHGVTQPVEVPVDVQIVGGMIAVVSSFEITLSDYGIDQSNAAFVASIEEQARIELQLFFART